MSLQSIYQTRGDITNPNLKMVMAKLAVMNPKQLQAFAAAHEDDPIMLSAAQAVHSKHKEFAEAMMARQGGEAPPVNQQVVQGMAPAPQMPPQGMPPQGGPQGMPPQGMPQASGQLPEQQGIAQLPAPNIQNMAGGGIVAFADGGYTDDELEAASNPVLRMAEGGIPHYSGDDEDQVVDEFKGIDDQIAANMERQKLEGAFDAYSTPTPKAKTKAGKDTKADTKTSAKDEPTKYPTYTPKTPEQIRGIADLMAKPELAEIEAGYKPFAQQFASERERLAKREKGNAGDAIFRAGLAMLAGKSSNALQNIGEGGIQGLNAYQEAQKADDAARKALMQSEMLMTQAQRAERSGARKDAVTLTHQAEQSQQMAVQLAQHAAQLKDTKEYHDVAGRAALMNANAAQTRASALGDSSGDKHIAALAKVQNALNADKEYQEASKMAKYNGPMGVAARAKIEERKREIYRLLAPELLESLDAGNTAAPTGGKLGGGTFNSNLWGQPQVVTPK